MQIPMKNEVRPQMTRKEKLGGCPVEVPQVQIIDETVQVPVKNKKATGTNHW